MAFEGRFHPSIEEISEAEWRSLEDPNFPFLDYQFLLQLEQSASVGVRTGWHPYYFGLYKKNRLVGAVPTYLRTNSYGEYIFDWTWAQAYESYGKPYYPKMTAAVPFTPASGPKLLINLSAEVSKADLLDALVEHFRSLHWQDTELSGLHLLFLEEGEQTLARQCNLQVRSSFQFHWRNANYQSFEEFVNSMNGKRRRQIIRERRQVAASPITIETLSGEDLNADDGTDMYRFYCTTIDKKSALPYLTEEFFENLFQHFNDRILYVRAIDTSADKVTDSSSNVNKPKVVAASLSFYKGSHLFGRYWGALTDYRHLHFELCYYQPIEFAIAKKITLFEAGAQGEHKLQRGFLPTETLSAHLIRDARFAEPIAQFIEQEKIQVQAQIAHYLDHSPFKSPNV